MANGKPTLRDVAAEAGVSPMTASNALHGKAGVKESTRAKVLAAAKKTRLSHQSDSQHAQIRSQQHYSHHRQRIRFAVLFRS